MSILRRSWKPVLAFSAAVGIGTSSYLYLSRPPKSPSFEIAVKSKNSSGRSEMTTRTLPLLSKLALEERLTAIQGRKSVTRHGGIKWNWHTAQLNANDPIEDTMAQAIVERDEKDGDYMFFAVMDGHGGFWTSRLLEKVLIPSVALEIGKLGSDPVSFIPKPKTALEILKSYLPLPLGSPPPQPRRFTDDPKYMSLALQTAFANVDSEIINAPLRILSNPPKDMSAEPMALPSFLPAMSGSCALLTLLDTANRDLYVACTGDSRAVAGSFDPSTKQWSVEVLTEDQTGRNPNELTRIQSEHPADEAGSVIKRGRILGGLEPSRAFGDARYKWPRETQQKLSQLFSGVLGQPMRSPPGELKTPPYVTCQPVITHRKLDFLPSSDSSEPGPKSSLRFLVLATDGLWDRLSSAQVVSLVSGYLAGVRGTIPRSTLPVVVANAGVEGKAHKPSENDEGLQRGTWVFQDDNLATHLLRNSLLGPGGNEDELRKLVSIPPPLARSFRDDTSITVVWWEEDNTPSDTVKAKL
ncbi:protein serine/threonine phosphatase 2C [Sistotremastrum suecicum HHB10207 ss-3]|uniref:Protein serine/threonine phosphatase 2C n=1 Tax=Sistotremastrum suecicum HHB10207 ss-3 TaxID=1314776 RepID=A0A166EHG4_9AGAM|nr:protein serine/threonine phosphatase 2C [Sistotremastrum suecicum HHB10207 ss-3]